jgi:hypothetical protein
MRELNIEAERAAFEAWLGRPMMNPEQPTHYNGRDVKTAWGAWQEATRRAAPADVGEDGLPDLPERDGDWAGDSWWTADSMRQYARDAIAADRRAREKGAAALPEMDSLADIAYAQATPDDWDVDYRTTWQKLQVAERNKMQWRAYALDLRAQLARQGQVVVEKTPEIGGQSAETRMDTGFPGAGQCNCCDTPRYCGAALRCTAKDGQPVAAPKLTTAPQERVEPVQQVLARLRELAAPLVQGPIPRAELGVAITALERLVAPSPAQAGNDQQEGQ